MQDRYQDALDYLYGLVNFEHSRIENYAPENISLERPSQLLGYVGDPHQGFESIHIAGTKGKGSVAAIIATCLRASGLSVGLYTSPHLQDFRDRIRILTPDDGDGRISPDQVVDLVDMLRPIVDRVPGITWYELVTTMAFLHFKNQAVDMAVVEVGLGGRLDATNLLSPMVTVITSLSLDHTHLLGDTLPEIAAEKGGIIKHDIPVITSSQRPEALVVLDQIAREKETSMVVIGRDWMYEPGLSTKLRANGESEWRQEIVVTKSPDDSFIPSNTRFSLALAGQHQQENAMVALATLDFVHRSYSQIDVETIRQGLAFVQWPGRLQLLTHGHGRPTILLDCAHNVDSAQKLALTLTNDCAFDELWLLIGVTVDKDVRGVLNVLLPMTGKVILTASSHPRATTPAELLQLANELGFKPRSSSSVAEAIATAWQEAGSGDLICVTGSIFIVGDLLNQWEGLQSELLTISGQPPVRANSVIH